MFRFMNMPIRSLLSSDMYDGYVQKQYCTTLTHNIKTVHSLISGIKSS
jgi:hypothetical protein